MSNLLRTVFSALVLVSVGASAQDLARLSEGLTQYNAGNMQSAAPQFFALSSTAASLEVKQKSEYYLASSLLRAQLPLAALTVFASIAEAGPSHPFHLKAIDGLINIQQLLQEDVVVPSLVDKLYNQHSEAWGSLPADTIARVNYLVGRRSFRGRNLAEAKQFFESVSATASIAKRARYMLGLTLSDPQYPASDEAERQKNIEAAAKQFATLVEADRGNLKSSSQLQQLAALGMARVTYGLGRFDESVKWYESIPRTSKFWQQALFENGFARFQNEDSGGALGSLQALHAPQFDKAFQPESWILKSTVYYFSCLFAESRAALVEFEKRYEPMARALKAVLANSEGDFAYFFGVLNSNDLTVPQPVRDSIRSTERVVNLFATLRQIEREREKIQNNADWRASGLGPELLALLEPNRQLLEQLAGRESRKQLSDALQSIEGFLSQAEVIRFEIAKREKEFAESGDNVTARLSQQRLYRPQISKSQLQHWKFQGEFWRDEIGSYQYTLKNGCPASLTE
jgi:hypothetical protein